MNVYFRFAKIFIFIIRPFGEKLTAVSKGSAGELLLIPPVRIRQTIIYRKNVKK